MANVLIVDDSADIRDFCELIGRMCSMRVTQARSADEAIRKIQSGKVPNLVLLDLMMPGSPPGAVIRALRSHARGRETKVVIMSALRDVSGIARAMGADGSLRKPFDMASFVDVLRRCSLMGEQEHDLAASSL